MASDQQRRKRHHYVPQGYQKCWADPDGDVIARFRGRKDAFKTRALNVAVEGNLYTIEGALGQPDDTVERELADYVDKFAPSLLEMLATKASSKNSVERREISDFLAMQLARTPDSIGRIMFVNNVIEKAAEPPVSLETMRRYLTEVHLLEEPPEIEVKAAADLVNGMTAMGPLPSKKDSLEILFRVARERVSPILQKKAWSIEIDPRNRFVTSDLPVNKYWANANNYEGVGVENADEIRFPIDPGHLLVMRPRFPEHRVVVPEERVSIVNRGTAARCYRFVIGHPDQKSLINELPLSDRPAALRFHEGPLLREDGRPFEPAREVIHTYVRYESE
jgi:hypothetical protein